MEIGALIIFLAVLIFAAHFFEWIFSHTKIPDALLLMCVGLLAGPILGLIPHDFFGEAAELAVMLVLVIVLFEGGLDLRFKTIKEAWQETVGLAVVSFFMTMVLVGGVLWIILGFDLIVALMVGSIVGGTSSVVVIPLIEHIKIKDESKAMLTLESVFSDVLAIVFTIALLEVWVSGQVKLFDISLFIIISFFGAAILGVVTAFVWARLLSVVRPMQNSVFTTPAAVLLLFGITEQLGWSGPIAALAFGVVMGNMKKFNNYLEREHPFLRYALWSTTLSNKERLFFSEAAFLLQTFFFVFVGISMRAEGVGVMVVGLALVMLMIIIRPMVVKVVVKKDVLVHDASVMSVMVPKGLAAAALATLPLQIGIKQGEVILGIVYAVILFSVLGTSLLVFAIHRTGFRQSYASMLKKFS